MESNKQMPCRELVRERSQTHLLKFDDKRLVYIQRRIMRKINERKEEEIYDYINVSRLI